MVHIIGQSPEQKKQYWVKRINDKLTSAFDTFIPSAQTIREWSKNTDIDQEKLQGALLIISHGFDQLQHVVNGEPDVVLKKLETKGEEIKSGERIGDNQPGNDR